MKHDLYRLVEVEVISTFVHVVARKEKETQNGIRQPSI
jgi:hypothetical protein